MRVVLGFVLGFALGGALVACGSKHASSGGTGSAGEGGPPVVADAKTCDDVRARVEQLYRAEAERNTQGRDPARVEEAVADNTAMVMTDCQTDPARFVPCIASVPTVAELERTCVIPLDDEGTEGER